MYSEMVVEDNWEPTPWPPEVRACAVPDVLPVGWFVFWTATGAVVVALALGVWVARRVVSEIPRRCAPRNDTQWS